MEAYGIVAVLSFCHFFFFFLLSSKLSRLTRAETLATQAIRYAVFHWLTVSGKRRSFTVLRYCLLRSPATRMHVSIFTGLSSNGK